jgi:hypothetical protein
MPGHSRSKNGVASFDYAPGIHAFLFFLKTWMAGTNPAMTVVVHDNIGHGAMPAQTLFRCEFGLHWR